MIRRLTQLALLAAAAYVLGRTFGQKRRSAEYSKSTWRERQAMKKMTA